MPYPKHYLIFKIGVFVLISRGILSSAHGQSGLGFYRISLDEGLSQATVTSIAQDKLGFIWFGTQDGLNRFDGNSMKVFRQDPLDSNSLPSNFINSLENDCTGMIWVGTADGLAIMDPWTERTTLLHLRDTAGASVRAFAEDLSGNMWIGSTQGLDRYHRSQDRFVRVLSDITVTALSVDHHGNVWVGTIGQGLYRIVTLSLKRTQYTTSQTTLSSNIILSLASGQDGKMWIGTPLGLDVYDDRTGSFESFHPVRRSPEFHHLNTIRTVVDDGFDGCWIGTMGGGLSHFNGSRFTTFLFDSKNPNSLSSNFIHRLYRTPQGGLWIGTGNSGAYLLRRAKRFEIYRRGSHNSSSISISGIVQDENGKIWLSCFTGGLNRFDLEKREITMIDHALLSNKGIVRPVVSDHRGSMWFGMASRLYRYSVQRNQISELIEPASGRQVVYDYLLCATRDREGRLWFGGHTLGIFRIDPFTGSWKQFIHDDTDTMSLSSNTVYCLYQDTLGVVWAGTADGLNRYWKGTFTAYRNNPGGVRNARLNRILCIHEDKRGSLWMGTYGGGLSRFDRATSEFEVFTSKQGLSNDVVYGILEDDHGFLWLSTNRGLSKFDMQNRTFRNYDKEDGLQSNEFNQNAFLKSSSGWMFFGGVNGLNVFHPDSIVDDSTEYPVLITRFKKYNRVFDLDSTLAAKKTLELNHDDRVVSFEYAMLSFDDPNRNRYRYRLDGFDPEWVEAGSRREATYTNLDPGQYVFRVKGANPDGVWNENEAALHIVISPPFWQTWWFLTTVVLLCGGGLSGMIVYRVRQLLKIERLRMQIAADLHDSIGTGLTEISILSEVGSQQKATDSASAREWFDKIGETARTLGQSMSDVIWLINPKYDSVGDIILQLKKSYDEIFFHSNIVFRAPSAADWNSVHLPIEHRKHLYLVLKEAINNSLKHSHCKTILVEAESNDRLLHIRYADDGIGFDSACQFDGNGLYNIKQRIVAIGGSITNDSQVGKGSCLTITLPGSFRKTGGAE